MDDKDIIAPYDWVKSENIIKVIGVGGGGCNAVEHMYKVEDIKGADFIVCNTDKQALRKSEVPCKIQIGGELTKGLGAGCDPLRGRKAALESQEDIKEALGGKTEMVFVTCGMGGGTGTGAAPVIADIAHKIGLLTVGVVTVPFEDEGYESMSRAIEGIHEMEKCVDSLLIINNQKLYEVYGDLPIHEAFPKADEVLATAVRGITEIIMDTGYINVDFADVRTVMKGSGMALMGSRRTGTFIPAAERLRPEDGAQCPDKHPHEQGRERTFHKGTVGNRTMHTKIHRQRPELQKGRSI